MFISFSLRGKLLTAFLVIVGLSIPLNWFTLHILKSINHRYTSIILQSFPRNQVLFEIGRTAVEISHILGKLHFGEGDKAQMEGTPGATQEYALFAKLEHLNQWKDKYDKLTNESPEAAFLDTALLKSIENKLILQTLDIINLQENRSTQDDIEKYEKELRQTQKQLDHLIAQSTYHEANYWFEQLKQLQHKASQINLILMLMGIIDLGLMVLLAIFISHKIVKPIIALRNVVAKVSAGDYKVRINNNSDDEIGQLSADTNAMIENLEENQKLQAQLMLSEKMASLGQLAAGIAHEINTPIQYIGHNIEFLKDSFMELIDTLALYKSNHTQKLTDFNADELREEIEQTIKQSMEGIQQITKIIKSMNEYSHPGTDNKTQANINHIIENTLEVTKNQWKDIAQIITHLHPDLPLISCLPNEINQVLLILIVNATHAIESRYNSTLQGIIEIYSEFTNQYVEIKISDNGTGIPQAIQSKVFDPFFTTKEVGKGTGQGLTIAHAIIEKRHGGKLTFESHAGQGTTFIIKIPI